MYIFPPSPFFFFSVMHCNALKFGPVRLFVCFFPLFA